MVSRAMLVLLLLGCEGFDSGFQAPCLRLTAVRFRVKQGSPHITPASLHCKTYRSPGMPCASCDATCISLNMQVMSVALATSSCCTHYFFDFKLPKPVSLNPKLFDPHMKNQTRQPL